MKKVISSLIVVFMLVLASCSSTQSLQEYYIDNSDNPNFLSVDLPVSLLNMEKADLNEDQREALNSLKKMNVLAFKKTDANTADFEAEKLNVKAILKNEKFIDLMKLNTSYGKGVIKYMGNDEMIDEVIIYGDNPRFFISAITNGVVSLISSRTPYIAFTSLSITTKLTVFASFSSFSYSFLYSL